MFIKISTNPPPSDVDVLFKLLDGTKAVGRKDFEGKYFPTNVSTYSELENDENSSVYEIYFYPNGPVEWQFLPD